MEFNDKLVDIPGPVKSKVNNYLEFSKENVLRNMGVSH